jgi:homospermidine synthase
VEGYVKTNVLECFNNKLNKVIGYGSITDGTYKLEIHILEFEDAKYSDIDIKKGDKIQVQGSIQSNGKNIP